MTSCLYKSSATSLLALLGERDPATRTFGLEQLDKVVDELWPLVADGLDSIVSMAEDSSFEAHELASLLASKVYFHLGEHTLALKYALAAGKCFSIDVTTDYTQVIVAKAVCEYINSRGVCSDFTLDPSANNLDEKTAGASSRDTFIQYSAAVESLVERLISKSVLQGKEKHALGICIEARRLDLMQQIFSCVKDPSGLIKYLMSHIDKVLDDDFKLSLYNCIIDVLKQRPDLLPKHYSDYCQSLYKLRRVDDMATLFEDIVAKGHHLIAKQLAFDLVEIGDHAFVRALDEFLARVDNDDLAAVASILNGFKAYELYSIFLRQKNHTDIRLLEHLVAHVDQRSGALHHALVVTHGFMQCGTLCDVFLRNNLTWLAKANNWARFSATASLGVVHKGNIAEHNRVLQGYLPTRTIGEARVQGQGQSFSEGGSLYALGLIHANFFHEDPKGILLESLNNEDSPEPLLHGGALGLGLVCMGTCDDELYKVLRSLLYKNNATSGQAAAIGIGMIMLASGNKSVLDDLIKFMDETDHEKITRACALAVGMVLATRPSLDTFNLLSRLAKHSDATVRYGAMFSYGLAFCNTSLNSVIKELLHKAVSDTDDNVRRAAVISLAFVMCNRACQVPKVLKLLAGSHNVHVRYGVALAIGIACASTAQAEALATLVVLTSDRSDLVRQGAYIALGLVLQCQNYASVPSLSNIRDAMRIVATDKHNDVMARFGAIVGLGLMDAGGQNCIATMYTHCGHLRLEAVVGFYMFAQHWYWHPYLHMITAAFSPVCFIGISQPPKSNKPPLESPNCGIAFAPRIANLRLMIKLVSAGGYPVGNNESFKGDMMHDYIPPFVYNDTQFKQDKVTAVLSVSAKRDAWKQHQKNQAPAENKLETSSVAATMGHSSYAASSIDLGDVPVAMDQDQDENENVPLIIGDQQQDQGGQAMEQDQPPPPPPRATTPRYEVIRSRDDPSKVFIHVRVDSNDEDDEYDASGNEDYDDDDTSVDDENVTLASSSSSSSTCTSTSSGNVKPHVAVVENPCRLLPWQKHLYKIDTSRFTPAIKNRKVGIVLMHDARPHDPDDNLLMASDEDDNYDNINSLQAINDEATAFEPFEWEQATNIAN